VLPERLLLEFNVCDSRLSKGIVLVETNFGLSAAADVPGLDG
jgi:hypothetical protein